MAGRSTTIAALDIGTNKVCCFIGHVDANGQVRVTGIGVQHAQGMRNGSIVDMSAVEHSVRNAVHSAETMAGTTVQSVVVNVSGGQPVSHSLNLQSSVQGGEIGDSDVARVMSAIYKCDLPEDREILHAIPVSYQVDGVSGINEPRGMYGRQLGAELHVVTAATGAIRNLRVCVERCHLEISNFVLSSYASGLSCLVEDEMDLGVTCMDIGGGTTSVAVFMDGSMIYADTVPVGGAHITSDIARGLSTSLGHAERLKNLHGGTVAGLSDDHELIEVPSIGDTEAHETNQVPRSLLVGIIRPRVEEIFELARERLIRAGYDGVAGRRIVLTGGTAQLQGIRELASTLLDRQVRIGKPVRIMGLAEATIGPAFSVCAGLLQYIARGISDSTQVALQSDQWPAEGALSRLGKWIRSG